MADVAVQPVVVTDIHAANVGALVIKILPSFTTELKDATIDKIEVSGTFAGVKPYHQQIPLQRSNLQRVQKW